MGADGRLFVLFAQLLWKFVEMVTFGLSRCLPSENIFIKVASALNTFGVANCLPQLVA